MKYTKAQFGITFFILILGCILITEQRAQAATKWVQKTVSVPYTYYEYETQTRYRLVRKAYTVTEYRYERRAVTTYRYERQRVAVEIPTRHCDVTRIRYVWKNVRIPETTYETVRVPYQKTVYRTVREPYYVRVRVERTAYRTETQWAKVYVPDRDCTRNVVSDTYGGVSWTSPNHGFTLRIGFGSENRKYGNHHRRWRKHRSIRYRDNRQNYRDSCRAEEYQATPKKHARRGFLKKTGQREKFRRRRKNRTGYGLETRREHYRTEAYQTIRCRYAKRKNHKRTDAYRGYRRLDIYR